MKAKKRTKRTPSPKVQSKQPTPEEPSVSVQFRDYYAMKGATAARGPAREKAYRRALDVIHGFADMDERFAEKTPHPFKVQYSSSVEGIASVASRHLIRLALQGNESAIRELANLAVEMTETLTELLRPESTEAGKNMKLMSRTSTQLPYWPVLYFRNTAANNHLPLIADGLGLGKECPINVSESANFSGTPINWFVWKCLRHFQDVHRAIESGFTRPGYGHPEKPAETFEQAIEGIVIRTGPRRNGRVARLSGIVNREDLVIYKASFDLPPLTKSTAKKWADVAILPYVCSRYPDFSQVPQFEAILKRPNANTRGRQRREIRKDILRSVKALARPG